MKPFHALNFYPQVRRNKRQITLLHVSESFACTHTHTPHVCGALGCERLSECHVGAGNRSRVLWRTVSAHISLTSEIILFKNKTEKQNLTWAWWHTFTNPQFRRLNQDNHELEASKGYYLWYCLTKEWMNECITAQPSMAVMELVVRR